MVRRLSGACLPTRAAYLPKIYSSRNIRSAHPARKPAPIDIAWRVPHTKPIGSRMQPNAGLMLQRSQAPPLTSSSYLPKRPLGYFAKVTTTSGMHPTI